MNNSRPSEIIHIFFSVDIIGSTAFKHSKISNKWVKTFNQFFTTFPDILRNNHIHKSQEFGCDNKTLQLEMWKTIGDEIVFQQQISNPLDALFLTDVFKTTLIQYRKTLLAESAYDNISLKGSGWVALTNQINSEIFINNDVDYIGPTIDTGFRISKLATDRKFTLSIELALILLSCFNNNNNCNFNNFENRFIYYFDGEKRLKGVLGNRPYPIVWLDTFDGGDVKDNLKGYNRAPCQMLQLKSYLIEYAKKVENDPSQLNECSFLIPDFIRDHYSAQLPKWYENILVKISDDDDLTEKRFETLNEDIEPEQIDSKISDEIKEQTISKIKLRKR